MWWSDVLPRLPHVKGVTITRQGQTLVQQGDPAATMPVGCVFKALLAMLAGAALQEGRLTSLDQPLAENTAITLRHALSNTTGLRWPGPGEALPATLSAALSLPAEAAPGAAFAYKPDPQLAVYWLENAYGMPVAELFREKIAAPLALGGIHWPQNNVEGLQLSLRQMDALGQLMLRGGDGLFTPAFIRDCLTPHSPGGFPEQLPYGLGWWIGDGFAMASGFGGQMIALLPRQQTVISVLSAMDRPHPENRQFLAAALASSL